MCIEWFLINLMTYFYTPPMSKLRTIPVQLMTKLISHSDLFVMKTEITVYVMLVQWMYLFLHPDETEEISPKDISQFFSKRKSNIFFSRISNLIRTNFFPDKTPFLLTEDGQRFVPAFQGLRLQNLLSHHVDVELILRDNIIPKSWIHSVILHQWKVTLRVNQNEEKG